MKNLNVRLEIKGIEIRIIPDHEYFFYDPDKIKILIPDWIERLKEQFGDVVIHDWIKYK